MVKQLFNREKVDLMCERKDCCQKPEELKGDPQECSSEQIQKCHGDAKEHPCAKSNEEK
jgi:hypothetical protein